MDNIFEQKKSAYEEGKWCSWDDVPQEYGIEEKMQYLILQQRYKNLNTFLTKQHEKYGIENQDIAELKELLFYYNDLKEINYVGTDIYANALFFKHKVPYLYRSVGKDTKKDRVFGNANIEYIEHTKTIFRECLKQIETGGRGELFSYTKCFGKMLYKYSTLLNKDSKIVVEVRKDAIINAISEDGKKFFSIQKYIRECAMKNGEGGLPYFAIDMSNARDNSVECLKYWLNEFLGKQEWHWNKEIMDPIGDAEVVCNFTNKSEDENNNVQRMEFSRDEFCVLLYKYFSKYAEETGNKDGFDNFIIETLKTLKYYQDGKLKCYYEKIMSGELPNIDLEKINVILMMIGEWKKEIEYMSRRKGEIQEQECGLSPMKVYKGSNAEEVSGQWKDILFRAIEKKYSYIDYSAWK